MLVNINTGQQPTENEMAQIRARAWEILDEPYASPEQVEWALMILDYQCACTLPEQSCTACRAIARVIYRGEA